ncbi:enterobacterial common antigen (ECA) biosynthesis protein [unidentified eubacterium SCB49]|nr:enterobacterial common antigen (ECA) biosynthesis protein [unidentified eubacterium SCB49]
MNAPIIIVRQILSLFIRRIVAENFGEVGIDIIGQVRSIQQGILSLTSFGFFNGMVKYVAEYKEDQDKLNDLFSTAFVFWSISSLVIGILLAVFSTPLSQYFFESTAYSSVLVVTGIVAPAIGLQRIYNGVINGLTEYKRYAKVDLSSYLISAALLLYFAWNNQFTYALYSIIITPAIQLVILLYVFFKTFKKYINYKKISFKIPFGNVLLAFTLISFFSTVVLSFVEIEIRNMVRTNISQEDSGLWSGMLDLSKNYMAFSSLLFTMYVIPKFATIKKRSLFFKEVKHIYISLLPLFAVGMLAIYFLRHFIIDLIFPGFDAMAPLFKWQLMGDFIRLASIILATQFLAKKMVRNFIFSEVISLGLFFGLSFYLVPIYGVEGVVMAHFYRCLIYLPLVAFLVWRGFKKKPEMID